VGSRPLILLTNDDGIGAPGLNALREAVARIAAVEVVAPERPCSAAGHAVSVLKDMSFRRIELGDGFREHSLMGMPADCVKLAVTKLFDARPDLIISGINRGSNVANNILYSGTVAAALEGAMLGVPSIAISLSYDNSDPILHFETAAEFAVRLAPSVIARGLPKGTILNVNVPNRKSEEVRGVVVSRQGEGMYIDVMEPSGGNGEIEAFRNVGEVMVYSAQGRDCDDVVVRDGFISITPLRYDLTDHGYRDTLRNWLREENIAAGLDDHA
jgi:5'-nucleotidase